MNNILERIILIPIIKNVEIPNYPSEDFQDIKRRYCTEVLYKEYGNPSYDDNVRSVWERPEYMITLSSIGDGRNKYCGGNIEIEFY